MNSKKFQNKYRIPSARMQNWDYGWNGSYFITICTKNREHFFGTVIKGEMQLSDIGEIANKFFKEIPDRYDYAKIDEFIVMPNHIHGIKITPGNPGFMTTLYEMMPNSTELKITLKTIRKIGGMIIFTPDNQPVPAISTSKHADIKPL